MNKARSSLVDRALKRIGLQRLPSAPTRKREGAFVGAQNNRFTLDWVFAPMASPDKEQKGEMITLRKRGREVVRNTAVGSHFMGLLDQNVIGAGIKLQAKNYTSEGVLHSRANAAIEEAFADWSEAGVCTMDGRQSFTEALGLGVRTMAADGEWLVEMVEGDAAGNGWGFALNLLDADLLDESLERAARPNVNEIRQGVEVNAYGRAIAYWFHETYPGEIGAIARRRHRRVEADRIIHLFVSRRARQSRGLTWFAPILMDLRMYAGYVEAELIAARIGASKMGFIQPAASPDDALGDDDTGPEQNPRVMDADPGTFGYLNAGETLAEFDPQHPTTAYRDFTVAIQHHIASGLGISYGTLTGDLSQANYSSMRVGQLAERDFWKKLQALVITHVCKRVYRKWLKQAMLYGRIPTLGSFDASRWQRVQWVPRGYPWVDPEKDIRASKMAIGLSVATRTRIAAENGDDLEDIIEEKVKEIALYEAAGLELPPDLALLSEGASSAVAKAQNPEAGSPEDDSDEDRASRTPQKLRAV